MTHTHMYTRIPQAHSHTHRDEERFGARERTQSGRYWPCKLEDLNSVSHTYIKAVNPIEEAETRDL